MLMKRKATLKKERTKLTKSAVKEMDRMLAEEKKRDRERDSAMEKRRLLEQRMEQIYLLAAANLEHVDSSGKPGSFHKVFGDIRKRPTLDAMFGDVGSVGDEEATVAAGVSDGLYWDEWQKRVVRIEEAKKIEEEEMACVTELKIGLGTAMQHFFFFILMTLLCSVF